MTDLAHLAHAGALLTVRVVAGARREELRLEGGIIHIRVTAAPENGKANRAVIALLAPALGVAKSRLALVRGATARTKIFRVD